MKNKIMILLGLPKSLYFNLKYFGIKGIQLPFFLHPKVKLKKMKGEIKMLKFKTGIIRIGFSGLGIVDEKFHRSIWENSGKITFCGSANIGSASKISVGKNGNLKIGMNFNITGRTEIICHKKIIYGNNVLISWDNLFLDTDFHKILNERREILNTDSNIIIGNNCWICCKNTILKGATLPDNTVLGAGSILSKKYIKTNTLLAGSPLKVIKENINWEV